MKLGAEALASPLMLRRISPRMQGQGPVRGVRTFAVLIGSHLYIYKLALLEKLFELFIVYSANPFIFMLINLFYYVRLD